MTSRICSVALPVPLRRSFDYLIPAHLNVSPCSRVEVPWGKSFKLGLVLEIKQESDFPLEKLKPVKQVLDSKPLLPNKLFELLNWSASYYQHSIGDVFTQALPILLRQGEIPELKATEVWQATELGQQTDPESLKRATKQQKALILLNTKPRTSTELKQADISTTILNSLKEKQLIEKATLAQAINLSWQNEFTLLQEKPQLNKEQAVAISAVNNRTSDFACYLLEGVTGSGKTEVYLNLMEPILKQGKQALILVPEIGLTPQTIQRFKSRFNVPIYMVHSGLNNRERLDTWVHARQGSAAIVLGTRSAIFTPLKNPGIIILDEEHDSSFKQQDTFRYHARDLAVIRAHREGLPIILGSATPSLETLQNAKSGKYHHLVLSQRAGTSQLARHYLQDIKDIRLESGLSPQLIELMKKHLNAGNQVMLFLNRRGYAPALMCHECGWLAHCQRCDAYYTVHQGDNRLVCHHCGSQRAITPQCGDCGSTQMVGAGVGTEQLEQTLNRLLPDYPTVRIDRDSTRRKGSLEGYLDDIHQGKYKILIGTQMLAKGHHFPDVTLVALLDVDSALFSSDFRAAEKLAQLFIQVAGRAGRASKPGQVVLQTHHPEHYLLQDLVNNGYQHFADSALVEREEAALPPFAFQALIRAEAPNQKSTEQFLNQVQGILSGYTQLYPDIWLLGPMPAQMERRAGKYRMQLLVQAPNRALIAGLFNSCLSQVEALPESRKVRWSLDVEPTDFI